MIKDAKIQRTGTPQSFRDFIKPHVQITQQGSNFNVAGNGFSIGVQRIEDHWPANIQTFPFRVLRSYHDRTTHYWKQDMRTQSTP